VCLRMALFLLALVLLLPDFARPRIAENDACYSGILDQGRPDAQALFAHREDVVELDLGTGFARQTLHADHVARRNLKLPPARPEDCIHRVTSLLLNAKSFAAC